MPDSIVGLEYLPNVHINKINYQKTNNSHRVVTKISLYDYETLTWSADNKFTSYLQVLSKFVTTIDIFSMNDLIEGTTTIKKVGDFETIPFSSFTKSSEMIRGKMYTKYTAEVSGNFLEQVADISYFCCSAIDVDQLKQDESLDLSYIEDPNYLGSLKSEKIIENNSLMSSTFVFRDEEGVPWSGPVHTMINPTDASPMYMAGSQHGETPEKILTLEILPEFSKIKYNVPINIQLPSVPSPSMIFANLDVSNSLIAANEFRAAPPPVQYSVHQEEFVEDSSRNVSNTVVADIASVMEQESVVGSVMSQYYPEKFTEICNITNIQNIEINRYPLQVFDMGIGSSTPQPDLSQPTLVARSSNNRQKVKNKTLFKISPTEIVSVDPTSLTQNNNIRSYNGRNLTSEMLKNASRVGKIEQLNLSLDPSLRPITFTDYSIQHAKDGRYKYGMKISIEDQHLLYCKQLLKDLIRAQRRIKNLYDVLVMKNVYNGNEFSIEFLQEFYSQYNISVNTETGLVEGEFNTQALQDSYLVKSFELLLETEKLIGQSPRAPRMVNNLNLFTTDLDEIQLTAFYFGIIIHRFKTIYDLSDGMSFEKSSTKSRKDRGLIEKTIILREEYKRELIMPIGINFINMNTKLEGLPIMSMANFDTRASKEVSKFFNGPVSTNSELLSVVPDNIKSAVANIEETKYMNFSPAIVSFGGKEVDTTEISPKSFDADFFNNIRVASIAMENEDDVSPENVIDEEQLEKYLDSREYLGDTSKFNNILLNSLKQNPALLPKIRKKFKFLDNSILKAKKKNISLKTFDLSQPDNFVVNNLMSEPNSVPLQIKALSLLKTPATNFDLETIQFDPISNPQTQEVFMQNYLNIGKVQALMGFEKANGRVMIDKPIYREIDPQTHEKLKNMNVLCRVIPQSLEGLGADHQKYNIHDKVFVMNSVNDMQIGEEDV